MQFRICQRSALTRLQIAERKRPFLHAAQARAGKFRAFAESADLPVAALEDRDEKKRGRIGFVQKLNSYRRCFPAVDFDGL